MPLDLDTTVLEIRDQSTPVAWTDQYPDIDILTKASRLKYAGLEYKKNLRYSEFLNALAFEVPETKSPDELVRSRMSKTDIFTSKVDYFNLTYTEEKAMSPLFSILFLVFMGIVGLVIALKLGRRRVNAH